MRAKAYYNEIDAYAAAWLRNLISVGHIAPGDVDERSIEDVSPDDLRGYTQCHFFAGIGVWSHALRNAGWPDDRPVWTGSCPCPPFSAAGKGSECPSCGGKSCLSHPVVTAGWICLDCGDEWRGDDRHLLPEFIRLKGQCRPPVVFGEQVASRDGRLWLYTLRAVMEEAGYAVGAADLCAAGVGAPHIRQRLWWVDERLADTDGRERERIADGERRLRDGTAARRFEGYSEPAPCGVDGRLGDDARLEGHRSGHRTEAGHGQGSVRPVAEAGEPGGLADAGRECDERGGRPGEASGEVGAAEREARQREWGGTADRASGASGRVADTYGGNAGAERQQRGGEQRQQQEDGRTVPTGRPGPVNGVWRDADWLFCRDGKWRPVEPGTFPLAHGAPARVGRLRAYGNAIVAQAAQTFIEAYLESRNA